MKFSIIIPCYNLKSWIRACLDSVAKQSFRDWECIVIDDESADGSGAILDEYANRFARLNTVILKHSKSSPHPSFRIIHQKNAGEGGARNAGLAVAQGEWVFFLDGDDVMSPGALERLSWVIERNPNEELIRFGFENFEDGEDLGCVENRCKSRMGGREKVVDISRQILYDDYYVYVWQFVFRRTMITDMKFDRYKRGADRTFIVTVLCFMVDSFVAIDDACYYYRQRQMSAMNSRPSIQVLCDEMDHRLDVAAIMDKCSKRVGYARTDWIERYFTTQFPCIISSHPEEFDVLLDLWHQRLRRARMLKGLSPEGRLFIDLHASFVLGWVADLQIFPALRKRVWFCRVYRFFRHTGEYAS